ncbi:BRCT domain-containing protein At4g02110-like isoform X1 [Nicotiana tomentosiformis]|uniref:BRCT domain-containing protein At4g02110-like isoform X1 n=2 Tax=Nicotiana tomentosiformis TaxID=4098 RepID=UPI00051C935F|nr:BRCT domain-containing protein At4g02110-like isoform X1 [Nicotiana tomentosiformis]XP_016440100.1 PREDICTED: BRCT domain-containing protein At4g02110-like isoform X1 [Nicotiana tabacum]
MTEGNQDMLYEDRSKIFIGVRFVLVGFDPLRKGKIRLKLLEGGGVDVSGYGPDCTHLIVDSIVYDDPICLAARQDGKIIVTSLWVEHSYDVGMPFDHHSIMYRPPRDLNGISGAKSLVVCLTGYQGQDRDDIMKMVGLMGANFSKPLVANKVTHLICYKFEGDKYELAKKMKTIKFVNHHWLEDCLRSWEILPEDDYDKSGYELMMMEAEAKDSEEENEGIAANRRGEKIAIMRPDHSKSPNQFLVKQEASTNILDLSTFRGLSGLGNTKELSLSASKQSKSHQVPAFEESPNRHAKMLNTNLCRTKEELPSRIEQNGSDFVFVSSSARKSPHSCSSQEIPRKFNLLMTSEQIKTYAGSPATAEAGTEFDFLNLPSEREQEKSELGAKTSKNLSFPGKGQSSRLPEKRKLGISDSSFQSSRTGNNPESIQDGYLTANRTEELVHTSKLHSPRKIGYYLSYRNTAPHYDKGVTLHTYHDSTISNPVTLSTQRGCDEDEPQSGTFKIMESKGISHATVDVNGPLDELYDVPSPVTERRDTLKSNVLAAFDKAGDDSMSGSKPLGKRSLSKKTPTSDVNGPLDELHDVPSPVNERRDTLKSNVLAEFNKAGDDSVSGSKPMKKRSLSKKTLGSRQSFRKGDDRNQKGSLSINKTALMSDSAASSSGGREETEHQNILSSTNGEVLPANNADSSKENERNKILDSKKETAKTNESINDDTEAPEDQDYEELNVLKEKSTDTEAQRSRLRSMEMKLNVNKVVNQDDMEDTDVAKRQSTENNKSETQKILSDKKTKLSESTSVGKASVEKVPSGPYYLMKNSKKTNLATKRALVSTEVAEGKKCRTDGKKADAKKAKGSPSEKGEVLPADLSKEIERNKILESEKETAKTTESISDDTEAPKDQEDEELNVLREKSSDTEVQHSRLRTMEKRLNVNKFVNQNDRKDTDVAKTQSIENNTSDTPKTLSGKKTKLSESTSVEASEEKVSKGPKHLMKNSKKTNPATKRVAVSTEGAEKKKCRTDKANAKKGKGPPSETGKTTVIATEHQSERSMDVEKENIPDIGGQNASHNKHGADRSSPYDKKLRSLQVTKVQSEPRWFIVSGHRLQRKEFQQVIKRLKGKVCRDSHQWSYQATHFIVPAPLRRTEKFFAAASSGRWILKTDYLTACVEAGKFLDEEPYEWHRKGLTEDLAINLEAPRKWRLLRERTGHGALYGMRIIIYGDCIVPPLDTLKRAVKAGDGIILATSPPYSRFLESGVDFAIVSEVMPRCDKWVQEFLRHEIPCVLPDYLVTYVCKPGYPLNNYVQYNTHAWAERVLKKHVNRLDEIVEEMVPSDDNKNDLACQVCGSPDREEVMLICGDESGSHGCGIGMHVDCCDPPLECVPEEDWFCPECSKTRSNTSIKRKSKNWTSTSKRKK